jgi:integrase
LAKSDTKVALFAEGGFMRRPFTLYKKETQTGLTWYARFWNERARKYTETRSTGVLVSGKKGRQQEAWNQALLLLPTVVFDDGPVKASSVADEPFLDYCTSFWSPTSYYIKDYAEVKKVPLSAHYVRGNADDIRLHVKPYEPFQGITLKELTPGHIRGWMRWAVEQGKSGRRVTAALSAIRVAVRYAVANESLARDPFVNLGKAAATPQERGILSQEEVATLINTPITNIAYRAVVLLAVLCGGMRRGEIRGLLWGDISNGIIDLSHNYVELDGMKKPKRGSSRKVPIPKLVEDVLEELKKVTPYPSPDSYVFQSLQHPGQPMSGTFFRNAFSSELESIGIPGKWHSRKKAPEGYVNEQARRHLCPHSMRHEFVTLARMGGMSDLEVQSLAGHKDSKMMIRYSHPAQVLDFDATRRKLENAMIPQQYGKSGADSRLVRGVL